MAKRFNCPNFRLTPTLEILDSRALPSAIPNAYLQTALVADQDGEAALTDANLVNPWGLAINPTGGAFWVANNGTNTASLYTGDVDGSPLAPGPFFVNVPGGPTGQVFNGTDDFTVTNGTDSGPARFIFVNETGQITGWNPAVPAPAPSSEVQLGVEVPGAVFTGVAIGSNDDGNFLFAADFANGAISVFDKNFDAATLEGDFIDPHMHQGFAPFNIQNLGDKLYVTYALREDGSSEEVIGQGKGYVSVFDTDGNFLERLINRGRLNAPWGLALAPESFGKFGGDLLVGNIGDGRIHAYDADTGGFRGTLKDANGRPLRIEGLWGMAFGNGVTAGDTGTLYFTAGTNGEENGLFGSIAPTDSKVPPPVAVVGADAGGGPHVRAFDNKGHVVRSFFAFDPAFRGGVRVGSGDVNGDGSLDIVTAAGPGGGPHIRVFSGVDGSLLTSFFAYDTSFRGGLSIAVGDVDGDGFADIVTGADAGGGPHVKVFSGADGSEIYSFFAYDSAFRGGLRVAVGDVNDDGLADIVTAAGVGGGPHIKVFDGATGELINSFFAGNLNSRGGVFVAAGDLDGDYDAEIVVGSGPGGSPQVRTFDGTSGIETSSVLAFDPQFAGGVRVSVNDFNDDGEADILMGAGRGGGPALRFRDGASNDFGMSIFAFDKSFRGGVFVG